VRKTFKYRIFSTPAQDELVDVQLGEACRLYNGALQERRDAWKQRVPINYYKQANQLKEIRAAGDLGLANFSCCQDLLRRVHKTYESFFRRVQRGEKAGYPRFKSRRRFAEIGIDVGLESFATLSNGKSVPNPRWYKECERKLRRAQRRVARRRKGSHRRRKAVALLQKIHQRIKSQRNEFQHKFTFWLVQNFGVIAIEDLNVKGLAGGMLAKSVHDVSWAAFFSKLAYKAGNAGRRLIAVNPRGTSQTCLCGTKVLKRLSDREHVCTACGLIASRDHVSAQVIIQRARISPSNLNVAECIACVV